MGNLLNGEINTMHAQTETHFYLMLKVNYHKKYMLKSAGLKEFIPNRNRMLEDSQVCVGMVACPYLGRPVIC